MALNIPSGSTDLSTLHALSSQMKAASGRFGRVPSKVSQYHGVGDFSAAPIQNVVSGGDATPTPPPAPIPAPPPPPTPFIADPPPTPPAPLPGVDQGEVIGSSPTTSIEGIMGENIGKDMATGGLSRSVSSALKTGGLAYALEAPMSAAQPAVLNAAAMANLNPVSLALDIGDAAKSASDVSEIGEGYANLFGQEALDEAVEANAYNVQPKSLEAETALAMAKGYEPKGLKGLFSEKSPVEDELQKTAHAFSFVEGLPSDDIGFTPDPEAMASLSADLASVNAPISAEQAVMGMPAAGQMGGVGGPAVVGSLGPGDVGLSNAPATATTPGAVGQPSLFGPEEGFSAPQGARGTTTGNFGGGDDSGLGAGDLGVGGVDAADLGAALGSAGVGADGGDTVICTELYRQGLMSSEIYEADCNFGATIDETTRRGYQIWGKPLARAMSKSKLLTTIAKPFVLSWANHMAYGYGGKRTLFGTIALFAGIPICRLIGRILEFSSIRQAERSIQ